MKKSMVVTVSLLPVVMNPRELWYRASFQPRTGRRRRRSARWDRGRRQFQRFGQTSLEEMYSVSRGWHRKLDLW